MSIHGDLGPPPAPGQEGGNVITAPAPATVSRLVTLPEELLSSIGVKLGSDDIFSLRLTCRDIYAKTLHEFATEYFSAKCFIFTTESLKVLGHIASHHKFRDYLSKIFFAPAEFDGKIRSHCEHGAPIRPNIRQSEALAFYVADQKQLRASGDDRRLLVEAFSKLPAVRRLGIVDHFGGLPEGTECRGMHKALRTTGSRPPLTHIHPTPGHPGPPADKVDFEYLSYVWTTTLHALSESGTTSLTHLSTDLAAGLSPLVDLKFEKQSLPGITNALSNLEELSLQVRTRNFQHGKLDGDASENSRRARIALTAFASALPKLTCLKISFDLDWKPSALSGRLLNTLLSKIDAGALTNLTVDSLTIDLRRLADVVCQLKSVQTLAFHAVDIVSGGGWVPILEAITKLPEINHLHLMYVTEADKRAYFLEQPSLQEAAAIFGQPFAMDNEDQWTEDETTDSDGEIPEMLPGNALPAVQSPTAPPVATAKAACRQNGGRHHKAPCAVQHPERGYYVCVEGREEIQRELPQFIEKYNVGESANEGGMDGNLFVAGLGAALGMGGPVLGGVGNANAGVANLQAMFGAPLQFGGNAQNGFAAYAMPAQMGPGGNPFANLFPANPPAAQPAPPAQQVPPSPTGPGADALANLFAPFASTAQQAPPAQQTPTTQQVSQQQQGTQSATTGPALSDWDLPTWATATESAPDSLMMEDELD